MTLKDEIVRTPFESETHVLGRSDTSARLQSIEARLLEIARSDEFSPYFVSDRHARSDRRRFLAGAVTASAAALGASRTSAATALGAVEHDAPADATKTQGYPLEDESYGS